MSTERLELPRAALDHHGPGLAGGQVAAADDQLGARADLVLREQHGGGPAGRAEGDRRRRRHQRQGGKEADPGPAAAKTAGVLAGGRPVERAHHLAARPPALGRVPGQAAQVTHAP